MPNDADSLAVLQDYYARHRVPPSYAGIDALVGLSSKASVADLVLRLKAAACRESAPGQHLKPGPHFFERALAEGVPAGMPSPGADTGANDLTIDEYLVQNPSRTVLIRVKGELELFGAVVGQFRKY